MLPYDHDSSTRIRSGRSMKGMQETGIDPARANFGAVSFDMM